MIKRLVQWFLNLFSWRWSFKSYEGYPRSTKGWKHHRQRRAFGETRFTGVERIK